MNNETFKDSVLNRKFQDACDNGNIKALKSIVKDQLWEEFENKEVWLKSGFLQACKYGHLDTVKYFLNTKKLQTNYNIDMGFCHAAHAQQIEVVKYLLTSAELKVHSNIHFDDDSSILQSCQSGNLNLLKYLTQSPYLKDHIDIHTQGDIGFKEALRKKQTSILEYMIIELNFEKTEQINKHLIDYPNPDAEKMFTVRNTYNNLNKELHLEDELIVKKNKI